jgi:hypothetical protein
MPKKKYMQVRNIIPVIKVTITTVLLYINLKLSKIMIVGQIMERTNSPIFDEGQPAKTVLSQICIGVFSIR